MNCKAFKTMINVIPKPNSYTIQEGFFVINSEIGIQDATNGLIDDTTKNFIYDLIGWKCSNKKSKVIVKLDNTLDNEEYVLDVSAKFIEISANGVAGIVYAFVTLNQLKDNDVIKNVLIKDKPLYPFRGLMLDVARHFFSKDVVKRLIDYLCYHKLNYLHLHLSDDQGFRLVLDKFPELINATTRPHTRLGDVGFPNRDNVEHSGYYTKDDIKEIVEYASVRNVTIIPEIDMPGHTTAILSVYPHLSCTGEKVKVWTKSGIQKLIMCGGNDKVYEFAKAIIDEIVELFPSKYIHLGGDECSKYHWNRCPMCQEKIKNNNLKDSEELQAYFFNELSGYLKTKGRTTIGWNECLDGNIDPDIVAQYWTEHDDKNVGEHIGKGGKVILSRCQDVYLNMNHAIISLEHIYMINREINNSDNNVLGLEACKWTEWTQDTHTLEFRLFPRLTAFSEVCWTIDINYDDFVTRYNSFKKYYDENNINYCVDPFIKSTKWNKFLSDIRGYLNIKNREVEKHSARRDK